MSKETTDSKDSGRGGGAHLLRSPANAERLQISMSSKRNSNSYTRG